MYTDEISVQRILNGAHPLVREKILQFYFATRWELLGKAVLRMAYVYRSWKEQDALYQKGRTTSGKIVTNAKAGDSWHNYGFAFDIVLLVDKDGNGTYESASWETDKDYDNDGHPDWMEVVKIAKALGFEWGGDWKSFKDKPHFQMIPEGLTIQKAKEIYLSGRLIVNTPFISI